jgi:hypothetical protein
VPLSRYVGALTSWNPLGLSRPVMGLLYLLCSEIGCRNNFVPYLCTFCIYCLCNKSN